MQQVEDLLTKRIFHLEEASLETLCSDSGLSVEGAEFSSFSPELSVSAEMGAILIEQLVSSSPVLGAV